MTIGASIRGDGLTNQIMVPLSTDPTVLHTCIYDLHICTDSNDPKSCKPLGAMYYEFDEKTGAASTSIPMTKSLSLPKGSDKFVPRLCSDQVS